MNMKTFTIDAANKVAIHSGDMEIAGDGVKFASETGFTDATAAWPVSRLVDLWNNLPGAKPVAKFKDRNTAIRRIWAAVEKTEPTSMPRPAAASPKKAAGKKAAAGSKTDQILAALRSPNGVTLAQLMKLTGWQAHSVRGFLSAQVAKRMGLRVKSFKRDGERCYKIRG
jgi:hypothetical protein